MKMRLRSVLCMALSVVLCMSFLPALCADAANGGAEEAVGFISGVPDGVPSGDVTVSFYAANPTAQAADYVAAVAVYNGNRLVDAATANGSLTSGANMETPLSTLTVTVPEGEGEFQCKPFFWYADNMEPIPLLSELPTEEPTEEPTEAPTPVPTVEFTVSSNFENADRYLYRVGNGNNVKLGSLFETVGGESVLSSNNVNVTVSALANSGAGGTYTKNSTNWANATIRFSGYGPVAVTIRDGNGTPYTLNLEVVAGNNATTATSATGANIVLLNDVHTTSISVNNGKTLYGNGFHVIDDRDQPGDTNGFVTINNGTLNNVQLIGYEPENVVTAKDTPGYSPALRISGVANIYNSYISGGRYCVIVEASGAKVYFKNTMLDGGALTNMTVGSGNVTLEDCVTTTSTRGGKKGLSIMAMDASAVRFNLKGTFCQYNWLTQEGSDIPSTYKTAISSIYSDPTFAYTTGGNTYANMGIFFINEHGDVKIYKEDAQRAITDTTGNNYDYYEKSTGGYTGTLYTMTAAAASAEMFTPPVYVADQYNVVPSYAFNHNKNLVAKTDGSDEYCYYDTTLGRLAISYVNADANSSFTYDPMILTVTKNGNTLPYTVSMDGVDYTDREITFRNTGNYQLVYTYTDPYNYDNDIQTYSATYTAVLDINVRAVDPEAVVYPPSFAYNADAVGTASSRQVVTNNKIYVMPDVNETVEGQIGSTTIGGQTVYYPIVDLPAKNQEGTALYANGNIYYYAPAFGAVNITDYDQANGEVLYTYNTSSRQWPHGESDSTKPTTSGEYYGYVSTHPWEGGSGETGRYAGFNIRNEGLCFISGGFNRDSIACTRLVTFYYKAQDGETYYYIIRYDYSGATYDSSCFAKGTGITMADGSKKNIEDITGDERIMAWDMMTGEYAENDIAILVDHGEDQYDIVHLEFSDGTLLRIIGEHGVFDYDQNEFVYVTEDNYQDFIGHRFVQYGESGTYNLVTLQNAYITRELTNAYSITSAGTMNAFAEGLLTIAPPREFYNWIPMGDTLRYDIESLQADIEEYGLYTYDDFKDYVTEEQFEALGGAYLKIPVEKGMFTFDTVREWIRLYGEFFL